MADFLFNLASFLVLLGILITAHEYGHFWVARKCGVKVERFSVGFGQAIWRKTDKHGTEFVIALIPLGGYVKMLDERVDDVSEQDKDKTFNCKTVYQRIAIIAAGPLANFAVAILAFYLVFLIGVQSVKPVIGQLEENSIAAEARLVPGHQIVEIAGKKVIDWQDVNFAIAGQIANDHIEIKTKSFDSQYIHSQTLNTQTWTFSPKEQSPMQSLGIVPYRPLVENVITQVEKGSPAHSAGLQVGDKLQAINGVLLENDWYTFSSKIKQYPNEEVIITIERNSDIITVPVTPKAIERNGQMVRFLGIGPKVNAWPEHYKIKIEYGPIDAIGQSINKTWDLVVLSFDMIGKLVTGDVSVKNLSGPISIAQGAGNSAGHGIVYFLGFLALISINLGIINLLPLPVLDGGHLLYYLIELLTGKPVPEKVQEIGFRFGAFVLLGLMSIAIFNDLS